MINVMVKMMIKVKEKVINRLDKESSLCKVTMCRRVRLKFIIMAVVEVVIRTITIMAVTTKIIPSRIAIITTSPTPINNPTVRTCPSSHRANSCN